MNCAEYDGVSLIWELGGRQAVSAEGHVISKRYEQERVRVII